MNKVYMGFFIFIFLSTTVFADAKNRGSIGTDSVFYRLDIAFDNLFIIVSSSGFIVCILIT